MNRKILAGVLAVSLILVGCGGGGGESAGDDGAVGDELLLPADRTTAAPTTEATAAPASPGGSSRPTSGGPTTLQPTKRAPVTAPPGPAPQPPPEGPTQNELGRGTQGSFAPSILRPRPGGKIRLELLVNSGVRPAKEGLDHLSRILTDVSGKPVEVTPAKEIPGGAKRYSPAEVNQLADRHGKANDGGPEATLHLLYLQGNSSENPNSAGFAIRGDVLAIFVDVVSRATVPGISRETVETSVLTHETGHLLGLVDLYLATGREDPAHPGHSTNKGSVMYWAVETTDVVTVFGQGGPPRNFDAADLADLANIKNGAEPRSKG